MPKAVERLSCEPRQVLQSFVVSSEDLVMHLSDALTVVSAAQQRYAGDHAEFVGVLDLIEFKLQEIRENYDAMVAWVSAGREAKH